MTKQEIIDLLNNMLSDLDDFDSENLQYYDEQVKKAKKTIKEELDYI